MSKRHIDIYTDGCWLTKGRSNPLATGGFGALIIELEDATETTRWHTCGPYIDEEGNAAKAELTAIKNGLEAVKLNEENRMASPQKPISIILYTDQKNLIESFSAVERGSFKAGSNKPADQIKQLLNNMELKGMHVQIVYAPSPKLPKNPTTENIRMMIAHDIASAPAYRTRLAKQGYIGLAGSDKKLTDEAAENFIGRLAKASIQSDKEGREL